MAPNQPWDWLALLLSPDRCTNTYAKVSLNVQQQVFEQLVLEMDRLEATPCFLSPQIRHSTVASIVLHALGDPW